MSQNLRTCNRDDSWDREAVREVLLGNPSSIEPIISKYNRYLYHLAYSFLLDREAAADAVQEIFLRVFERLPQFNPAMEFRPWLCTLALNYLRRAYRRSARRREMVREVAAEDPPRYREPQDAACRSESMQEIHACVALLPWKVREPIVLYYFHEMSVEQVAAVMRISRENVKSRLFRGRRRLRELIERGANQSAQSVSLKGGAT